MALPPVVCLSCASSAPPIRLARWIEAEDGLIERVKKWVGWCVRAFFKSRLVGGSEGGLRVCHMVYPRRMY